MITHLFYLCKTVRTGTLCSIKVELFCHVICFPYLQFTVMKSTYIYILRYILLHKALLQCLFTVLNVFLVRLIESIVNSKTTYKWQGPTSGVLLREVSIL